MTASQDSTAIDSAAPCPEIRPECPELGSVFERQLIAAAAQGCTESFRILVERHQHNTFHLCCRLLNCVEDAREACQDSFVRAYDSLPRFSPRARFSTWLYQIALNLCRDRLRARKARKRCLSNSSANPATELTPESDRACPRPAPDEALSLADDLAKLRQGMEALPPKLREPLILVAIEGLSHEECAMILRCSARAVEGRIYRARRELSSMWDSPQ